MAAANFNATPSKSSYDVVIIGGAMYGSSVAWFLTDNPDFDGSILVIERDPSYEKSATAHTNSCIRQQFSNPLNVKISQFGAKFIDNLKEFMGNDSRVPDLSIQSYGYMYLADNTAFADQLRSAQQVQLAAGAATQLMTPEEISAAYPFYYVDDIELGSINLVDEGYWDGGTVFDWWRRSARERGVEYVAGEVVSMSKSANGTRVETVTLANGAVIACGKVVNATGPRGAMTAKMAGIGIPIEPRKRFTWIFSAEQPLDRDLPLTIDPSGVHFRQDGPKTYLAGGHADHDPAVDFDDFTMDHSLWQDKIWPTIATRIPQFEAIKVVTEWAGHYDYNTLDQNAILGPHSEVENFFFVNGFSGHGLQQSPAMGRGTAEMLTYGEYRTLDLSPFGYDRIAKNTPFSETAII
ncbi:NAD(P)/FAD-dependent oxidoreductase [Octadecabacter ascidiaceicola]|uniref:4-methylaminobutanoate oxidase (Formaldehyde-forming) n=1 Tax=Octadecabacter ascidiaceicola TaxID=1655543 RepID=A0A238KB42_9RHOB|nr:FAD-binding oxidoreductase [Octadecabacter ascidiaceicola]SMX40068.1 4-methylaminobutanoate oxidase (formaldehyde-forming) [Octadecabacter ascidiaceicola]